MSVSFVQLIAEFNNNGAVAVSAAFTPNAADTLLTFAADFNSGTGVFTYTGTGTGSWAKNTPPGDFGDANGNAVSSGFNLSCGGGSQTISADNTDHVTSAIGLNYRGVSSVAASGGTHNAPGTTISGTAVTVAVGDILVAWCINTGTQGALNMSASAGGTNRALGTTGLFPLSYCVTEYAGTGGSITPTFTTSIGTDVFDVIQVVLSAAGGGGSSATPVVGSVNLTGLAASLGYSLTPQTA